MDFNVSVLLEFDENTTEHSVRVNILDDSFLEDTENFFALLTTSNPEIIIFPENATICILDNDGTAKCTIILDSVYKPIYGHTCTYIYYMLSIR